MGRFLNGSNFLEVRQSRHLRPELNGADADPGTVVRDSNTERLISPEAAMPLLGSRTGISYNR